MERRKAIAYAATSAMLLSTSMIAGASAGGFHLLGFGQATSIEATNWAARVGASSGSASGRAVLETPPYLTRYEVVNDYVVVPSLRTKKAPAQAPTHNTTPPVTTAAPAAGSTSPAGPTAAASTPSTTNWPPPGVPRDWPKSNPIPPIPSGCVQPRLEDDGIWNCQR